MKLKIFTFRYSDECSGFDDAPLQEFQSDKELVEVTDHFYVHDRLPHLTVLLSYREAAASATRRRTKPDPRLELDERERETYDALRSWRAATAKQNGIPAYLVATNRQLARMITGRASSLAALKAIDGFGEQKAELYGRSMLDILSRHLTGEPEDKDGEQARDARQDETDAEQPEAADTVAEPPS